MLKLKKITCCVLVLSGSLIAFCFGFYKPPTFSIEHARTVEQIEWGLMQRRVLPENCGMLFHYSQPQKVNFWSFNCYIDLSVAFIDEKGMVAEIKPLKAFPEKMDPSRPVLSNRDFALYSFTDPIFVFFQETSIFSAIPVKYVLEMNLGWFERNKVQVGDILHWNDKDSSAFFTSPN